jgi:hypothetical protein
VERKRKKTGATTPQSNKAGAMQLMGCERRREIKQRKTRNRDHHPTGEIAQTAYGV